mgnify:FL=1
MIEIYLKKEEFNAANFTVMCLKITKKSHINIS